MVKAVERLRIIIHIFTFTEKHIENIYFSHISWYTNTHTNTHTYTHKHTHTHAHTHTHTHMLVHTWPQANIHKRKHIPHTLIQSYSWEIYIYFNYTIIYVRVCKYDCTLIKPFLCAYTLWLLFNEYHTLVQSVTLRDDIWASLIFGNCIWQSIPIIPYFT